MSFCMHIVLGGCGWVWVGGWLGVQLRVKPLYLKETCIGYLCIRSFTQKRWRGLILVKLYQITSFHIYSLILKNSIGVCNMIDKDI